MALDKSPAATEESTPPDNVLSTKESILHVPAHPHTPLTKLWSILLPSSVCSTSGWNWIAYKFFSLFSAAATGQSAVCATILKPGAGFEI